jgi:hypothetical protein
VIIKYRGGVYSVAETGWPIGTNSAAPQTLPIIAQNQPAALYACSQNVIFTEVFCVITARPKYRIFKNRNNSRVKRSYDIAPP